MRVLTVSAKTDVKTTWYAGRYRYEELLRGGVRIYEYQPTMMHSKTIVADGVWSSIGSMNFDNRSMAFNNESNLVVLDRAFGAQMDSVFLDDLRYSKEIKLDEFRAAVGVVEAARGGRDAAVAPALADARQRMSSRPSAARTASRMATSASSREAGESSRTWSSTPSATATRRQLARRLVVGRLPARLDRRAERGGERRGDAALERVAGELRHLLLDDLERDAFALADLDREQLEEVAVVVGRRGAGALGAREQPVRDVEANRPRARRGARRRVGRANAGGVDERGDVRGEAARVPGRVARVRAQQRDR